MLSLSLSFFLLETQRRLFGHSYLDLRKHNFFCLSEKGEYFKNAACQVSNICSNNSGFYWQGTLLAIHIYTNTLTGSHRNENIGVRTFIRLIFTYK